MKKIQIVAIAVVVLVIIFVLIALSSKGPKAPTATPATALASISREAKEAYQAGRFKEARELLKKNLEQTSNPNLIDSIRQTIETINTKIIFSKESEGCSTTYVVEPRDTLTKIAKKFNTTVSLIKRSNNLASDTIRPKQKLKVASCKFSILIDKSQNLLFLKRKDEVVKTYRVSTGKDNSTPIGEFTIDRNKLKNPTWFKTGAVIDPRNPENILGSRWMGLEGRDLKGESLKGYGIHGTNDPDNLGKQITLGCIRMNNQDVEELFDIIPVGSKVTIID